MIPRMDSQAEQHRRTGGDDPGDVPSRRVAQPRVHSLLSALRSFEGLKGYLTHKKTHAPRILPQAYA